MNIANIRNSGIFRMLGGQSVVGNFGNLYQEAGTFQQTANNTYHFTGAVRLNGGSLNTADSIVLGERSGKFFIGDALVLAGGELTNNALITQTGGSLSVEKGSYSLGSLNKHSGTLSNSGTLSISSFNQSGGTSENTGSLTLGNADLSGSVHNAGTLTLTGSVTTRRGLINRGTLHNRGSWTETSRHRISGTVNNTGSINFADGFEFGEGRLNSSGSVQTNHASDIFASLGTNGLQDLHYVSLGSSEPQEVKTSLTEFFQRYVPGSVAESLASHASFTDSSGYSY